MSFTVSPLSGARSDLSPPLEDTRFSREKAVRIDHLESYKEGAGYGTFNLGVVAKWAEENGISRVVVQAGNQVKEWYGKPPRNFTPSSGVTRDGSSFNMEVRVPGQLTWWITSKPAPRS
jgi:hypothetical protein